MDASWAPLGWKRRPLRRSALHQKPPVRTHTRFPSQSLFSKNPDSSLPPQSAKCIALFYFFFIIIFKNMVTILLQPHLKTEVIFFQVLIKTRWQCLLSGCTWDQKIPSQQHSPTSSQATPEAVSRAEHALHSLQARSLEIPLCIST